MSELASNCKISSHKPQEVNLALMVESIHAQYFTPVEIAVKGGCNYTSILS